MKSNILAVLFISSIFTIGAFIFLSQLALYGW